MPDPSPADPFPMPPGPPFPVDLLADLHAGVLPDDVAAQLWPSVHADPDASRVIAALERTRSDLSSAQIVPEPPPPAVAVAIESALATIREEGDVSSIDTIADARDRQRDSRRRRGMVIASVAAGIIAVVTLVIAVSTATMSSQGGDERADDGPTTVTTPADVQVGTLLAFLGRREATFTGRPDPQRLARCLSANDIAPTVPVVGSGPLTVGGRPAVVILLSTGLAGRFDALVVEPTCDRNTPATVARRTLGAPAPTG